MLNKPLYDALVKARGIVDIVNEDDPATFSISNIPSGFARGKSSKIFASVHSWGESYKFCCPVCHDKKPRAFICHRLGTQTLVGKRPVFFSRHLMKCHNEECQTSQKFKDFIDALELPPDYAINAVQQVASKPLPRVQALVRSVELPIPCYALMDLCTPPHVVKYLQDRGFDIDELDRDFHIRYAPVNAAYHDGSVDRRLATERIIIPINQHLHMISWQGRACADGIEPKYYNLPKSNKKTWMYNFDKALMYPEVMIFEGVTNVWRTGLDSVALFGKRLSMEQLALLKAAWSFDGSGVICLDEDTYDENLDINMSRILKRDSVFAKGVSILRLRNGDAAKHTHARMRQLKRLAHELVNTDPDKPTILDENDVKEMPNETEQEPRENVNNIDVTIDLSTQVGEDGEVLAAEEPNLEDV